MTKFAILLGSAPEDFRQKKIEEMYGFLDSKRNAGDSIVTFANGISELMLEMVMDNSVRQLSDVVIEPVEITSQEERHCGTERREAESILGKKQNCHSRARHGNLPLQEDCRVKPDNDKNAKNDNDTNVKNGNVKSGKSNSILLYICTLQPVAESEKTIWLGGEEIRRDVIRHYEELAEECGIDMQVVMDWDSEMVREEELGWEEADNSDFKLMEKF